MKPETLALHAGYDPDPTTKAVAVPIYQTVAYSFDSAAHGAALFDLEVEGYRYTRIGNPTTTVLERRVAELEGGIDALAVSSGQTALYYTMLNVAESGQNMFLGSSGHDTFLADATTASTSNVVSNFHAGDDIAVIGLTATDFKFSATDTLNGLEIDAVPANATTKTAATVVLPGYTLNDIGSKLSLGLITADGKSFFFMHAN